MNKSEIRELKKLVVTDKQHIKEFLKVHKLNLVGNRVSYLLKKADQQMKGSNSIITFNFRNLWEIDGEPHQVRVEFTIDLKGRNQMDKYLDCQESLINKIVERAWPDNPINPQGYLTDCRDVCQHPREIKFIMKGKLLKVSIISTLCYCS